MTVARSRFTRGHTAPSGVRVHGAAEVLELGQTLFDAVIEVAAGRPAGDSSGEPFPEEEVRVAADEFFRALRMLLGVEGVDGA